MMSKTFTYLSSLGFILFFLPSCSKKDNRLDNPASYANAYFVNNSVLNADLGLKYEEQPVDWIGLKTRVLSGMGKFSFYNKKTGITLLEKELDVKSSGQDTLYVFQPDSTIAPQLIKNNQNSESAAPAGFIKLKIANYANAALTNNVTGVPYPKVDVIVQSTVASAFAYASIDTIPAVGLGLDTAGYYLVKLAVRAGVPQSQFKFAFLDHETKAPILNSGGSLYVVGAIFTATLTAKNIFTLYFTNTTRPTASTASILRNGKYYNINTNQLFR